MPVSQKVMEQKQEVGIRVAQIKEVLKRINSGLSDHH